MLAVKGNQGNLETVYTPVFYEELKKGTGYKKTAEKAHGQIEIREYYQTEDTAWMHQKKQWKGLWGWRKRPSKREKRRKRNVLYQQS